MSTFLKIAIGLLLTLPLGAYIAGTLVASQASMPIERDPIVLEATTSATPSAEPTPAPSRTPRPSPSRTADSDDHGDDDSGHGGDDDDVRVIRPSPRDVDDDHDDSDDRDDDSGHGGDDD